MSASFSPVALIDRKARGGALTAEELTALLQGYLSGTVADYQMSAWLMAVCWRGMTEEETLAMTRVMVESGETLSWDDLDRPTVDKHSTGGVGDKTSIVLVPLMAAAGAAFVKMSGRGLGHSGGTLDKLEAIPGFRVGLEIEEMRAQVRRIGCALVGQSRTLVPADGALYALRDVTATVESVPLIAGSIMSKKIAGGAGSIVLDVKWGSGAFMPTLSAARELAHSLVAIGTGAGRKTRAVLSGMEQPLGQAVGNALEVREAIETLRGGGPAELRRLALELGRQLMEMSGLEADPVRAEARLADLLDSGEAARRFEALIEAQGGDPAVVEDPDLMGTAPVVRDLTAAESGWVIRADARQIALAALDLGGGRKVKTDQVDPVVGVVVNARLGDRLEAGAGLAAVHARTEAAADEAVRRLRRAFHLSAEPPGPAARAFETL